MNIASGLRRDERLNEKWFHLLFAVSLGTGTVSFAAVVAAGEHSGLLGVLAAVTGASQLTARWLIVPVVRLWSARVAMNAACTLQATAFALVAISGSSRAILFLTALLAGCSRGWYWTAAQTLAANSPDRARRVATVGLVGSIGQVLGPAAVFGSPSFAGALVLAAVLSVLAVRHSRGTWRDEREPRRESAEHSTSKRRIPRGAGLSMLGGTMDCVAVIFVPALAVEEGLGNRALGAMVLAGAVAGVAGCTLVVRHPSLANQTWAGGTLLAVASAALYAASPSSSTLTVQAVMMGVAGGMLRTFGPVRASATNMDVTSAMVRSGTARSIALLTFPSMVAIAGAGSSMATAVLLSTATASLVGLALEFRTADEC